MSQQVGADVALRQDRAREGPGVALHHRVGLVPRVQRDGALGRVHHRLHGVADVVQRSVHLQPGGAGLGVGGGPLQAHQGAVRVAAAGGVAVEDPHQPAVHHRRVGVLVQGQPRGHLLHALLGRALVQQLGGRVHPIGQDDVEIGEVGGVQQPVEHVADRDAATAGVDVVRLAAAVAAAGGIQLDRRLALLPSDDRELVAQLAEVDPALVLAQLALRRQVALDPLRLPAGLAAVAVGGDQPVPVGVDGVDVVPVRVGDAGEVHLAGGDHDVGLDAVEHVPVDVQGGRERVVTPDLLQLFEGRPHD